LGLALLLVLSGCASLEGLKDLKLPEFKGASFGFNTYESAKRDFEQGRIMEARARVLAMDKKRDDYADAKRLLDKQIEPARLRLLRHYKALASSAEKNGDWSKAMDLYEQAASFSTEPNALRSNRDDMEMKMRQARLERLLDQRRQLDAAWLAAAEKVDAPKGVDPKDEVVERERRLFADALENRADDAYDEAGRYLRKGLPEVAYVEAESHLRLQPDSERGKKLMAEIQSAMPKAISVPAMKSSPVRTKTVSPVLPKSVTEAQIRELMDKGDWIAAKKYALVYRREGGKDAPSLLKQIQDQLEAKAAEHYNRGRFEFRREHLQAAIDEWSKAVALVPENPEYVESLRRAQQLQDRLKLLRDTGSDAPDAAQ